MPVQVFDRNGPGLKIASPGDGGSGGTSGHITWVDQHLTPGGVYTTRRVVLPDGIAEGDLAVIVTAGGISLPDPLPDGGQDLVSGKTFSGLGAIHALAFPLSSTDAVHEYLDCVGINGTDGGWDAFAFVVRGAASVDADAVQSIGPFGWNTGRTFDNVADPKCLDLLLQYGYDDNAHKATAAPNGTLQDTLYGDNGCLAQACLSVDGTGGEWTTVYPGSDARQFFLRLPLIAA